MQDDINYLRTRVDGIADVLSRNTVILEKNTESLREHMRRTEILEQQMDTALIPIRASKLLMKLIALLAPVIGAIVGLLKYLTK